MRPHRGSSTTFGFITTSGVPETSLALFPRWETLPYEATAPHVGLDARRMNALHQIRTLPAAKVVTSIDALMQRLSSSIRSCARC